MKRSILHRALSWRPLAIGLLLAGPNLFAQRSTTSATPDHAAIDALLHDHDQRIEFIENKGQFSDGVLFKAEFPLGQALATREGMVMKAYDAEAVRQRQEEGIRIEQEMHDGRPVRPLVWREKGHGWMMHFLNTSNAMRIESRDAHEEVNNYFTGRGQASDVHSYQEVWYTGVYRNTDVRYYPAADGSLEYDILCMPGSDPREIAIELKGIERLRVNDKGELVMPTSLGDMTYPAPVVYQRINGREVPVTASYKVSNSNVLGFTLGNYDRTQPLVIDPIAMRWATWVNTNSSGDNHGHAIWVDPSDGAIYVVARVVGTTDNITVGAFDVTANGNLEMIVGKYLEPATVGGAGTRVWQTYIGGSGDDNPYAMEQGPDGNLYITGQTSSTDFPLLGGTGFSGSSLNQQAQSDIDVFVLKINTAGTGIKAAVVGGNGADDNFDVRIATNGDVFVCGSTTSTNLLTLNAGSGASNTNNGSSDAFVFRINQDLSSLVWMRNYGGSSADRASIMLHEPTTGDLFVGGNTSSTNFPTVSPRQATRGGSSAGFLQRLTGAGSTTWSSYFSSATSQSASLLCMEFNTAHSEVYLGGVTTGLNAANISGSGVLDTSPNGSNDFYVARMGVDQTFIAGTYIGGTNNEVNMMGLNTDLNNDVFVFGYTNSTNFPVSASPNTPLQSTNQGSNDKVFLKLSADLSALQFSTYYGGTADDYDPVGERGIKFSNCRIYTIVTAQSNNIPLTQGALNTTKTSSTSRYEPGLVVWANPPDLLNNTITGNQSVCAGTVPGDITGSASTYTLPTIVRNNSASTYPSLGGGVTYQWQISTDSVNWGNISGATSQNLDGSLIGSVTQKTFIRRIIGGDACVLAGAADQVVTVKLVSVDGTVTNALCSGTATGSITATSDGDGPFTYLWSNGQTGATATGLAAGQYSVTVTDANQCSATGNFMVGQPAPLGGNVNVTNATCGNSNGAANANPSGGTAGYSYLWSDGQVGPNATGLIPGQYSVTITDANQCTVNLPFQVNGTTQPGANAGSDVEINCLNGPSIQLNGSSNTQNVSFSWTGPNNFTSNAQNPSVSLAGTYTLTVTADGSGCTSTDAVSVTVNTTPPGAQANGGTLTCNTTSVQLSGSGNGAYSWTGPNNFTSQDQNPTVSAAGTYTLTVTGSNGCTSQANAVVGLDDEAPGAQANGGTLTCTTTSVQLSGSGNGTFSWSGPNNFTSQDQNPTVNAAGTYTLTVTGSNGCTSQASAIVGLDDEAPVAQANGGTLTCNTTSVQLTGNGNGTFSWSGPNNFTSQDQNPTVNAAGTYTLTVTGSNGCTSQASAVVELDDELPGAQAQGGTLTCNTTSVLLSGSGNGTFSWTGPNNFTSQDQNPTVNAAGTYTLTVTGSNGCTSQANAVVGQDDEAPAAQANGGTLTCNTTSVQLSGSGNGTYSWSGPNNFTSQDQNPTVNAAGTYTLTVTGSNGCTSQANAVVGLDDEAPGAQANGGTLTCNTTSVQLSGSGNGSFSWSGPNNFTSQDQNPTVNTAGTYTLTVTGSNGCTSQASAIVDLDDEVPGAQANGGTLTCNTTSVQLTGSGNGTFSWSGPNNFTSQDQNPTVNTAGTYTLTVTGSNGCTSQASAVVGQDEELPGAQANGGTLTCNTTSVQLTGSGNGTFSWTGPNNFTSQDQNPTVNAAGTYTLTVTGSNGCTSQASAVVGQDEELPGAQANGGTLTCNTTSVQLTGSGNGTFGWSGPNNFTSQDQNPTVNAAGTYTLTVTGSNGCTSQANAVVELNDEAPGAQASGGTLTCNTTSVQLSGSGNGTFSWSGPNGFTSQDQNPTVNAAGTYTLTVTGSNGCTSQANAVVGQDDELPGAQAQGGTLTCTNTTVMLIGSGNGTFSWSGPGFSSILQNPTVNTAGTYILTVTGSNGCTSQANAIVDEDAQLPGAQASGGTITCENSSVILMGSGNGTYSWSGPNNFTSQAQNVAVTEAGTYTLTVLGANGCTSTATATVDQDVEIPAVDAFGGVINCSNTMVTLDGFGSPGVSFAWTGPNGFFSNDENPTTSVAGMYALTVTAANGCTNSVNTTVSEDTNAPQASVAGGMLPCDGTGLPVIGSIQTIGAEGEWTGPNNFQSLDLAPVVFEAGIYTFTVTGENGCVTLLDAEVTTPECDECEEPLILSCGPDTTVECGSALDALYVGVPILRKDEKCPEVNYYSYVDDYTGTCPIILSRTWTVADAAGDTATCVQTITIIDTQAPVVMGIPDDITVSCTQIPEFDGGVWAEDACKSYQPVYPEDKVNEGPCPGTYTIERIWWAIDDCGNVGYGIQTIHVVDDLPPTLEGTPADLLVQCDDVPRAAEVTAVDDCSGASPVTFTEEIQQSEEESACKYTILRTWTATDGCGNTAFAQQIIEVEDTQAPVFECEAFTTKAPCGEVPAAEECKVQDNCDDDVTITYEETSTENLNGSVLHVRTWTATDDCGNTSTLVQQILEGCGKIEPVRIGRIAVAPNPFAYHTRITISSPVADEVTLEVVAPDGRLLTQLYRGSLQANEERTFTFTEPEQAFGSYLLRMTGSKVVAHDRLISTR
ncbi:MAG: hypothetical protein IPN85_13790 [Flavobacteriales bacterium]|nr:hypothetical protein [Flavobacteriales bacterium]